MILRLISISIIGLLMASLSLANDDKLNTSSSSFHFSHTSEKAYQELLKLKVTSAGNFLSEAKSKMAPNQINGINLYLENCNDVIKLLITEDEKLYEELELKAKERIKLLKSLDKNSPYYLFIQAEVQMQWAAVKLKFGKRMAGINDGAEAYNLLRRNSELYPDFIPNKKTLGACKILIGSLPKQGKKWAALFGYKGDVKGGLADIQEVIDSDTPFAFEAKLMKGFIVSYVLGQHDEALQLFQGLALQNPDSQLLYLAAAISAKQAGKAGVALKLLEKAPKGNGYCEFYYLDYLKAEACLLTGEYFKSIMYSKSFIQRYKGKNYIKDAYLKLFLAHWFINDSRAENYLQLARENGDDLVFPDQYAKRFAEAGYLPNKTVTKARLIHDGGNYRKALQILNGINIDKLTEKRDQMELLYRKGRALQMLREYKEAVAIYKQVIAICPKDFPHYYGGNSSLQLGVIYWEAYKDKRSATFYLKEVPTYEGHEYEATLHNRAKALLAMMK